VCACVCVCVFVCVCVCVCECVKDQLPPPQHTPPLCSKSFSKCAHLILKCCKMLRCHANPISKMCTSHFAPRFTGTMWQACLAYIMPVIPQTSTHTRTHTHKHTHAHTQTRAHTHTHKHAHTYTHTRTHTHTHTHLVHWHDVVSMPCVTLHCLHHQPFQVGLVVTLHKPESTLTNTHTKMRFVPA
jgi:hypothetical protein